MELSSGSSAITQGVGYFMTQPTAVQGCEAQRPRLRGTSTYIGGITASLLLHGLALVPIAWGGHVERTPIPDIEGSAASQHDSKAMDSMVVVFTEDPTSIVDPLRDELPSTRRFLLPQPMLSKVSRPQVSAANLDLSEDPENRIATEADGNEPGRSMLFGRYMGQIVSRVERAWIRPRSVPAGGKFACRAQITQDKAGDVEEVTLQECTGDPKWQVSLVRAINAASPFPAPPDPSVFSNLLTVQFESDPYVTGQSEQGFEPKLGPEFTLDSRANGTPQSSRALGETLRELRPDGSVNLTIIGTPSHEP